MKNEIVICSSNQICSLDFDQRGNKARSRGCVENSGARVSVYDGGSYSSFDIECNRHLCNSDEIFRQIKTILIDYRLTDANGRRIAAGTKQMISYCLMALTLISLVVYYF
ncbi:unnamed protein product [Rotaria sordida]|uniref:Uncharacterized protein n=1 Tax=Rotaria sordida TaxID=392033 RepID=A0A815SDS7_9BILA|nr:unnamed protein product [Rotaria sordida]CAF1489840.1 unnamed protein product [Rotaria sordida]CAF3783952.1 unnamed protein product [Rotaria sordida]CAF4189672.1 unnamed protein product [Rotaria sordida]